MSRKHLHKVTMLLIEIKDKNITLNKALKHETHIELIATLDYNP